MAELYYFEIGCKENRILRKTILKCINQILGVFWAAQNDSECILHEEDYFLYF